jgi:hypothetical protein
MIAFCLASLYFLWGTPPAQAANSEKCGLQRVAQLEAKITDDELLIKVQVNGNDLWMDVNPATPISLISSRTAGRLKLPLRDITGATVLGGNGKQVQYYILAERLTVAGMTVNNVKFLVVPPSFLASEDNPQEEVGGGLGADFLSNYDIDFDLPHGKIALFSKDHCPGQVVYWTHDYIAIPFKLDDNNHIWFPTQLDGHEFRTLFSVSSKYTTLSSQAARGVFDLDPVGAGLPPDGISEKGTPGETPYYLHRFGAFDIGGVTFRNTELMIIRDPLHHGMVRHTLDIVDTPLKLGLHNLVRLHVYVAYGEKMLYVSAPDAQ